MRGHTTQAWLAPAPLKRCWLALVLSGGLIVVLANGTTLDLVLADAVYDWKNHVFPFRHRAFYSLFMHQWLKQGLIAVLLAGLASWLLPHAYRPRWLADSIRYRVGWLIMLALSSSLLVTLLKKGMPHACPWDVQRYGGHHPWAPTFTWLGHGVAGHCFPAGHATSALWLSGCCLFFLPHAPRRAALSWLIGIAIGLSLGISQQMRGAHFLSHTLTSMWIVCAFLLCILTFSRARL